jgi:hypothetical protein
VIHIVRDPRSYVTSHLNFSRQKLSSFVANTMIPFWQPDPFLAGEIPWAERARLTRFDRFCWIWSFKNRVMASVEGTRTPYFRLRFEDIFGTRDPEAEFARLTDFIGLPRLTGIAARFRDPVNSAARSGFPDWPDWGPDQCRRLQTQCGQQMAGFGYGGEPGWLAKLGQAKP